MDFVKEGDKLLHPKFGEVVVLDMTKDWCIFEYKYKFRSPTNRVKTRIATRAAHWEEMYMSIPKILQEIIPK